MSSRNRVKYKYTNRAKGAAIVRAHSAGSAKIRRKNKRIFVLALAIIIVALIDSILLISISSFSWIENTSSLKIQGLNMPTVSNRYYQVTIDSENGSVDLHDYFDDVRYFRFAKASSYDGKTFFFPKEHTSSHAAVSAADISNSTVKTLTGTYRKGDTTDFNTAYYNIDFRFNNQRSGALKYYLKNAKLFTVTGAEDSAEGADDAASINSAAEKCYRLSIQAGDEDPIVFSNDGTAYWAASNTNVTSSTNISQFSAAAGAAHKINAPASYLYVENATPQPNTEVFTVSGEDTADITVRIWFEVNDPAYLKLTPAQKSAMDDTKVEIALELANADSDVRSFFFEDYSMSTADFEDDNKRMYFAYYDDGSVSGESAGMTYIPMASVPTDNHCVKWRSANRNLRPSDVISATMMTTLSSTYSSSYFFYGSVDNNVASITYKWNLNSAPVASDSIYTYIGYGVTDNTTYDAVGCYGSWRGNTTPTLVYFDDKMMDCISADYNRGAESPIENAEDNDKMYLSLQVNCAAGASTDDKNAAAAQTIHMHYDEVTGYYRAYLPSTVAASTFYFRYEDGTYDPTTCELIFTAGSKPANNDVYTALGYNATGSLDDQTDAVGIGTWSNVSPVYLSTELIDHLAAPTDRYRITIASGFSYYMAGVSDNSMLSYAYVSTNLSSGGFLRYGAYNSSSAASTWSIASRFDSDTFYPVDTASTAAGYWNVAVFVDGTRDNMVYSILHDAADHPSLKYSTDNSTFADMIQIDTGRWCVGITSDNVSTVYYRFTAYTGTANTDFSAAVFNFTHDLSDGKYFTVTEPMLDPPAAESP